MNKAELVAKALTMELGKAADLEVMKVAELEQLIAANEEAGPAPAKKSKFVETEDLGSDPRTGKQLEIQIEVGDGDIGKADVFGGVNGHTFMIKRGHKVTVDRWIYDHLKEQITEITDVKFDPNGRPTGETETRHIPRYNISRFD